MRFVSLLPYRILLSFSLLAGLLVVPGAAGPAGAQEPPEQEAGDETRAPLPEDLPDEYIAWLAEVDVLMSEEERDAFLALSKDYQRDAFIEHFWRQRDPYPDTGRNELKDRWGERVRLARSVYRDLGDIRSRILLLNGRPGDWQQIRCRAAFWNMEVWFYPYGSDLYRNPFVLIIYDRLGQTTLWHPHYTFDDLVSFDRTASCNPKQSEILRAAIRWIREIGSFEYARILEEVQEPPVLGGREWVATFNTYTTDLPDDADTFDAGLVLDFPGWHQNRTVLQGTVQVPTSEITRSELGGHSSYNLVLTGEILAGDSLFDSFRYKYDLPASSVPPPGALEGVGAAAGSSVILPLVFQRYLRPGGPYRVVLKLEDLASGAYSRIEKGLTVPRVTENEIPPPVDPRLAEVLNAANEALASGETTVKIVPPIGDLLTGLVRFETLVTGDAVKQVVFSLNGEKVLTKTRPPFSVELDLGDFPRTHRLSVTAKNAEGIELASDEHLVNIAGSRFRIRLIEPQRGRDYEKALRARAEVELPRGDVLERVELFLNEERVATLYQEPFVQPILLPDPVPEVLYVRAVAYRADGSFTEDVVFVGSAPFAESLDVDLVELYTSVLDRRGRPVSGLREADFQVEEDGTPQQIRRFEQVRDLPIHATLLLDVSASMEPKLGEAKAAALSFFESTIRPQDRAALITFNDRPYLASQFTNRMPLFAEGLAGLKAERGTALYDSIIYSLFYFTGIKGQRALVVISDGVDESSRFGYDEALDYARRAGITLYTVSLGLTKKDVEARKALSRLADETGGTAFFLESITELEAAYAQIQEELRSQYLLAYQSSNTDARSGFRSVDVEVDERGLEVKTLSGYYP